MIRIYGKPGCGKCEAAKDKMKRLGVDFESHDIKYHTNYHEGWREDGSAESTAASAYLNGDLPVIIIDGKWLSYSQAMKKLKKEKANERTLRAKE